VIIEGSLGDGEHTVGGWTVLHWAPEFLARSSHSSA